MTFTMKNLEKSLKYLREHPGCSWDAAKQAGQCRPGRGKVQYGKSVVFRDVVEDDDEAPDDDDDEYDGPEGVDRGYWSSFRKCMKHHSAKYGLGDGAGMTKPAPAPRGGPDDDDEETRYAMVGGPASGARMTAAQLATIGIGGDGDDVFVPSDKREAGLVAAGRKAITDVSGGWSRYRLSDEGGAVHYRFAGVTDRPPARPLTERQSETAQRYLRQHGLSGESGWRQAEQYARRGGR